MNPSNQAPDNVGSLDTALLERSTSTAPNPDNPFLDGIYAPMTHEYTVEDLPISGNLPPELCGRYARIGPNPVEADPSRYHWFGGDGMVHGLAIENGRALWYRNRWIRSSRVAHELGEPGAPGARADRSDTVNTNVIGLAGRTWALVEAGSFPVSMSATFEEQRYDPFGGTLGGSFTAHPHLNRKTGNLHAITYDARVLDTVRHVSVLPDGTVRRNEPISVKDGPSIHDCAVTPTNVVVLDLPVTFSLDAAKRGQTFPFCWNTHHPARVGLLPLEGSNADVVWCDVDPCYVFHTGNAWDAGDGTVIVDVVVHESMFADRTGGPNGRCLGVERWTIDPSRRRVERRTLDDAVQEFPRFNEDRRGDAYRYLYTISTEWNDHDRFPTRLYKHDLERGARVEHDFGAGRVPGEFVFVAARDGANEDDGWMVGLVIDVPNDRTDFVVLSARDFTSAPVATVTLPHRIPPGFHGNWIPNEA